MRLNSRLRVVALSCLVLTTLVLLFIRSRVYDYLPALPTRESWPHLKVFGETHRNITRSLVIPKTSEDDTAWVEQFLGGDPLLNIAIYTVDDPDAALTVPENKGHEVMVYLTYIIDHYENLSDVTMFMHSHQIAWHNNDLLDSSAVNMVRGLSSQKVMRDGYMNMRCHLDPGCPDHIHPVAESHDDINIPEAVVIGKAWLELFPDAKAPPEVLSQPCCAQFAVSQERLRSLPLSRYVFFRNWLLNSPLADNLSGRVWEYVWQYIFAGVEEFCPLESICYCDGYGICFGGETEYQDWFKMREKLRKLQGELDSGQDEADEAKVRTDIGLMALDLENRENEAFKRGMDPRVRALEAGRAWRHGDGF